jgi:ribosomal protein S12 methylthiotransferase
LKTNPNKNSYINIVTLGCAKNLVDSEKLARQLESSGIKILHNSDSAKARTVVINTCGFIEAAKKESIDTILSFIQAKENGIIDHLYVIGCLSERYKVELEAEMKEVDSYFGVNSMEEILQTLGLEYKSQLLNERKIGTPSHYAFLKISEGCDRTCSFCAIPLIRGKHESRSIESLLSEAVFLSKRKVKELILIAQDLTYYGRDLYGKSNLAELISKLSEIEGIEWIRLHYAYPSAFPPDVIKLLKSLPKICKYIDIPFQHISDSMLSKMRRNITATKTRELIGYLRAEIPEIAIRTTLMVGHPGETEKDFEELVEFVKWARFDRLGVFTYSHEEDTFAAKNYSDEIPESIKKSRAEHIMKVQSEISLELNLLKIGKDYKVIIDRREGDDYFGRTEFDSPEVDNEVIIKSANCKLEPGMFVNVKITAASEYDLEARTID